ncbi:MAG: hypothetical protein DRP87_02320 [Spirochaetes bacterium]|nr:MAG: hypothetical protein DRP87_02320 [Spirochaetota bacterium]
MKLLESILAHPVSVLMFYLALLLFGTVSLFRLNVELLPDISLPLAHVVTAYENMPAEETEQLVTIPLENVLSSVEGVKQIDSVTRKGISIITLSFRWGADIREASFSVREKIDSIYPYMPEEITRPALFFEDPSDEPVIILAVTPVEGKSAVEVNSVVEKELKNALTMIKGVSRVQVSGVLKPEIKVNVDERSLYTAKIPLSRVINAVNSSVFDFPVGKLREGEKEYQLRISSKINSIDELKTIPILTAGGYRGLKLADLATVHYGTKERTSFFHADGREAFGMEIYKTGDIGTLNSANNIRKKLDEIREAFSNDLEIRVITDRSDEIKSSLRTLTGSVISGIAAAMGVLFLIMRDYRTPLIAVSSIPVCFASVFLFLYFTGISINIISLSGMAIGMGMIFDNNIIILTNLERKMACSSKTASSTVIETGSAIFGSTITSVIIFIPVLLIPGITGALFTGLALTIIVLLLCSYILSLTLTPTLFLLFTPQRMPEAPRPKRPVNKGNLTKKLMLLLLERPHISLIIFILISFLCLPLFLMLPRGILPEKTKGMYEVTLHFPPGTPVEKLSSLTQKVGNAFLSLAEVDTVYSEAGYNHNSLFARAKTGAKLSTVSVKLLLSKGKIKKKEYLNSQIEKILNDLGIWEYSIKVPPGSVERLLNISKEPALRLTGGDREKLHEKINSITERLESGGLISGRHFSFKKENPFVLFELKEGHTGIAGVHAGTVLKSLSAALMGEVASSLRPTGENIDIRVAMVEEGIITEEELLVLKIPSASGFVDVKELGDFKTKFGSEELIRHNRENSVSVTFKPSVGKEKELIKQLNSLAVPGSDFLSKSALMEVRREAGIAFLLALLLLYLVLGAQFESLTIPLLLLASLPLSLCGSFLLLALTGKSLNLSSLLGTLILLGSTVNSAIILFTGLNTSTTKYTSIRSRSSALRDNPVGSIERDIDLKRKIIEIEAVVRPVIATAASTVFALLPTLLTSAGSPHGYTAIPMIGGLTLGTPSIILLLPPLVYGLSRSNQKERLRCIH